MNTEQKRKIITSYKGKPLRIMEVCGTHTHEIFRLGIRSLLPRPDRPGSRSRTAA